MFSGFILWYVPYSGNQYDNQYQIETRNAISGYSSQLLSKSIQNGSLIYQNVPLGIQGDFFTNPSATTLSYSNQFNISMHYGVNIQGVYTGNAPTGNVPNKLVLTLPTNGVNPNGVVVDTVDNLIFVTNSNYSYDLGGGLVHGGITVLSGATDYYYGPGNISLKGYPTGVAFDPLSDQVFVAEGNISTGNFGYATNTPEFETGFLQVIDGSTLRIVRTLNFSSAPYDVTFVPYLNALMLTIQYYGGGGAVTTLNATTLAQVGYLTVAPDGSSIIPSSISYDPANSYVFVALGTPLGIEVINPITDSNVSNIVTSTASTPWSLTYDTSNGYIFASNSYVGPSSASPQLLVINGANNRLVTEYTNLSTPTSLVYDRSNHMVYVADFGANKIDIFDGTTGLFVKSIACPTGANPGNGPNAMDWDPLTGQIFVPNWNTNSVSVISASISITNQTSSASGFKPVDTINGTGQSQAFGITSFTDQNYYGLQDGLPIQQGAGGSFGESLGALPLELYQKVGLLNLSATVVNLIGNEYSTTESGNYLLSGKVSQLNQYAWNAGMVLDYLNHGVEYSATVTSIILTNFTMTINSTAFAAWNYSLFTQYNSSSGGFNHDPAGTNWTFRSLPFRVMISENTITISFTGLQLQLRSFDLTNMSVITNI